MKLRNMLVISLLSSSYLFAVEKYDRIDLSSIFVNDLSKRNEVTFITFGDHGTGPDEDYQYVVAEKMIEICKLEKCDFGLMLGDNFYEGNYSYDGVLSPHDPKFKDMFELPYSSFKKLNKSFHFWPVLGNHDYPDEEENFLIAINGQINYTKRNSLWRMPYSYYSIPKLPEWLNIFALDTELLTEDMGSSSISGDPKQEIEARKYLCSVDRVGWKFVMGHHPFITFGPRGEGNAGNINDMDAMAKFIHPILKDCDVDVYFSGHDHVQEHIITKDYELIVQGAGADVNPLWSFILENNYQPWMKPTYFSNIFISPSSYEVRYAKGRELGFSIVKVNKSSFEVSFYRVANDGSKVTKTYNYKRIKQSSKKATIK